MQKLIDPVCGMEVGEDALRAEGYDDVAFCCPACRKRFLDDPEAYLAKADHGGGGGGGGGCCGGGHHDLGHHHEETFAEAEPVEASHGSSGGCCGGHGGH